MISNKRSFDEENIKCIKKKEQKQSSKRKYLSPDSNSDIKNEYHSNKKRIDYDIIEEEHDKAVELLRSIDWMKCQNISRQNVIRHGHSNTLKNSHGKYYCHSFIFGKNMKDSQGNLSYWSLQYSELYQYFQELIKKIHPEHSYTNITVNKNLNCKRHTDGGNIGLSYIISFGTFTGGRLIIEDIDGGNPKIVDIYRKFIPFYGSKQPHETEDYIGERYSAVYYTSNIQPTEISPRIRSVPVVIDSNNAMQKKFQDIKKKLQSKLK